MGGAKKIGVAVDFSTGSKKALQWAADDLAGDGDRDGDTLVILHVGFGYIAVAVRVIGELVICRGAFLLRLARIAAFTFTAITSSIIIAAANLVVIVALTFASFTILGLSFVGPIGGIA